jgi:hypothetical protein
MRKGGECQEEEWHGNDSDENSEEQDAATTQMTHGEFQKSLHSSRL